MVIQPLLIVSYFFLLAVYGQDETTTVAESSSEDPAASGEPPTSEEPPASEAPPAPDKPQTEGCISNTDDSQPGDVVHPNLISWKEALLKKKDQIKVDMTPEENDDASTITLKGRFKAQMTQVENMMADDKLMATTNQMDIAYTMAKVESVLNTIGRNLYGINWRTKGCGAGFVLTNECGNQVKK